MLSYGIGASILLLYAHAGTVPVTLPIDFLVAGTAVCSMFLALSEMRYNDRFADHHLAVPQTIAHVAVQFAFVVAAPQIGLSFLMVTFLIFTSSSLSLSPRRALLSWTLMTLATIPLFVGLTPPPALAMNTPLERMAALLSFGAALGQCVFVGLYGNSLRRRLHKNSVELQLAYTRIEELAEVDELTGALNRRSIMRVLEDELAKAQRSGEACSVALIDLDWFKRVNDLFGHPTGDEVLRTFAITVFANIRAHDKFGRYGGEEFLLILPHTPAAAAQRLVDRLRIIIAELDWSAFSPGMSVTISGGLATSSTFETADALLAQADRALYAAKRAGRNRVTCAS
jgi:diguanylate cyclase (GGDEF)-like protein